LNLRDVFFDLGDECFFGREGHNVTELKPDAGEDDLLDLFPASALQVARTVI